MRNFTKKCLSVLLVISMTLGIVPPFKAITNAEEPTAVIYEPMSIDYAIFNADNMGNKDYYDIYAKQKQYYNSASKFSGFNPNAGYKGWQKEYRWDQFGYSIGEYNTMIFTPYGYMANAGHLQVCMGVTMKNDFHTHTKLGGLIEADSFVYAYTHLTWTVSKLSSPNTYDLILNGLKHMPEKSNPVRTGDMEYVPVSRQQNMRLSLGVGRTFAECDHIGASLRDFVVAFADTAGPSVLRVYPCDENERHSDLFKPGDTLYIKVEFNEALRFSDNQAAHGNITAKLIQEGSSGNYISGNLYKLKDNYLVFKFDNIDVSDFPLKDCTMTSIDISALFNDNGFPLNPIYGTRVANAEIDTTKFSGFGYTKAKSVVTDLAGNPIVNASVNKKPSLSSPCYIDGAGPYIYEVAKKGEMNNGDIKAGLTEPGTGLHASDIIAGVGDKITYRVYFNEKVNVNGQNLYSYSFYDMKATLNVKDGNGDYITLRSNAIMQVDWKLPNGISKGYVTEITFDPLVVQPGMVCDDEDGEIKIISVTPSDESVQITDLSGNMYDHTRNLEEVNKNPFILDIKPPETGTWLEDNGNVYTPVLDNGSVKQFYFPFTVTDESGTDDINGSFKWINGVNGTKNFNFEYAVTATATPPVESAGDGQGGSMDGRPVWRKGSMGQSYSFKQVSAGNFIHIRLIDGETYNIGFSSLEITGKDNAGNLATESFNLDYEVDLVAPEARIESVTKYRNISTSEGELRARVRVTDDNSGLSKVYYKWVPAGSERPSEDSEGWKATGSFAAGAGSAEVDANSDYITPNSKYSGDLYVKAVDMYNNTSVLFMGTYTYDLTAPEYTVEYSSEIAKEASLVISDLQDDSAAVFMVKKPGTENIYYVSVVDQVYEQGGDILNNLYYGYGNNRYENPLKDLYSWQKYRVIKREGAVDVYDFELLGFPDFSYYLSEDYVMSQILEGTYYGEIEITLLTGIVDKKASELDESMMDREYISETSFRYKSTLYDNGAFVYNLGPQFGVGYMTIIETAGTDTLPVFSETIVLNAAPAHPDVYQVAITTSDNILNKEGEGFDPDNSDTYMLSTLEGVNFNISIANKVVEDWGVKDVDFSNSYVTVYRVADIMGQYDNTQIGDKIYLEASGAVQNITLPAYDYPSGQYKLKLTVTSKTAGQQYEFEYPTNGKIYIDATGPSKEFGFAGFYSNISSIEFDVDDESYTFYGPVYNNNYSGEIPPGYMAKDNIIYIPATDDFNVSQTFYFSINDMLYDWNAKYGVRAMKVWNETEGVDAARSKELSEWKIINYAITGSLYSYPYAVQYVNDASRVLTSISPDILPLIRNTVNTIAIQVVNVNGKVSDVNYVYIYPVDQPVSGTVSTSGGGQYVKEDALVFTPDPGQLMDDVKIYVYDIITRTRTEITDNYNISTNSYSLDLEPGMHIFRVYAVDRYGNYYILSREYEYFWIDSGAPVVRDSGFTDLSDGKFEVTFVFEENTVLNNREQILNLYFDNEYMKTLGLIIDSAAGNDSEAGGGPGSGDGSEAGSDAGTGSGSALTAFSIRLPVNRGAGKQTVFEAQEPNPYGIYKVDLEPVQNQDFRVRVTISGVVRYDDSRPEGSTVTHTLFATLTDPFGYVSDPGEGVEISVENTMPRYESGYYEREHYDSQFWELIAEFNMPVMVEKSIATNNPSPYSEKKYHELPVYGDGNHTISFYDIFGTKWMQDITLVNVFNEFSLKVSLSETGYTSDKVTVTITSDHPEKASFRVYNSTGGSWEMIADRNTEAEFDIYENSELTLFTTAVVDGWEYGKMGKINIANILKGAPRATVKWYFSEFKSNELPSGVTATTGPVTAWYTTEDVETTPADGTAESYTFYPGDTVTSYTFVYMDAAGNKGSVTANLADLQIRIDEPLEPVQDTTAPEYDIYIHKKTGDNMYDAAGKYEGTSPAEAFNDAIRDAGYTQGYRFFISVTEDSPFRIILLDNKDADTAGITYDSPSDEADGVVLSGTTLTVTKEAAFKVVIVDSSDNKTAFVMDVGEYLDNTLPEAEITDVYKGMYAVTKYIRLTDKSNNDVDTGSVKLLSPNLNKVTDAGSPYDGMYYYEFTENKSLTITFQDAAGNRASAVISVDNLDTGEPRYSVRWTPYHYDEEERKGYPSLPPERLTNKDVVATVSYDKPIDSVSSSISFNGGFDWVDVTGDEFDDIFELKTTSDTASVTFKAGGIGIELVAVAINGRTARTILFLDDVIFKTPPNITQTVTYGYNTGFESGTPVSAIITLKPDKDAYCAESPTPDKIIRQEESISFTVFSKGNYTYHFTDRAGNNTVVTVQVDRDMDRTPPEIDIVKPAEETATSGDVTVLVSMNENGRLVVTGADNAIIFDNADAEKDTQYPVDIENNGSYQVTAWDNAGNRTTSVFTVGGIDKSPPSISFNPATLNIRQGSSLRELKDLLDKGYTVFDNISKGSDLTVTYDEQSVNLAQPGVYSVIYTAVDKAGNPGTATRFVRVYSNLELEVLVNDRKTFRDETTVIDSKTVTISVNNPLGNEPYTIYISRGIKTEGQMKYNYTIISPDGNNSFTLTSNGYYTLYIVTQSRQTYITRIYIEQ